MTLQVRRSCEASCIQPAVLSATRMADLLQILTYKIVVGIIVCYFVGLPWPQAPIGITKYPIDLQCCKLHTNIPSQALFHDDLVRIVPTSQSENKFFCDK